MMVSGTFQSGLWCVGFTKWWRVIIYSFDHPSNKQVNKALIQNVQGVVDDSLLDDDRKVDVALIKRMLWRILACVSLFFT